MFRADRRIDEQTDEANSRFSQFWESVYGELFSTELGS
jgi:hypothetical protein